MPKQPSRLRSLLSKIFETLLAKIVVGLIVLAIPLEVLTGYVTDYVWRPIITIFQWIVALLQSEIKAWHLLLIIFIFYFFVRLLVRAIKDQPNPVTPDEPYYYFIERGGYKWKVHRYHGDVWRTPFCVEHQVELSNNSCPVCQYKHTRELDYYNRDTTWDEVRRIAAAQVAGHYKS